MRHLKSTEHVAQRLALVDEVAHLSRSSLDDRNDALDEAEEPSNVGGLEVLQLDRLGDEVLDEPRDPLDDVDAVTDGSEEPGKKRCQSGDTLGQPGQGSSDELQAGREAVKGL